MTFHFYWYLDDFSCRMVRFRVVCIVYRVEFHWQHGLGVFNLKSIIEPGHELHGLF